MLKRTLILCILIFFALNALNAQEKNTNEKKRPEWKAQGLVQKLNLTDEQKSKMKDLRFEGEKKRIQVQSKIKTLQVEIKQTLTADKLDKALLEKKFNEVAKLQVEMKMIRINNWSAVNDILTPEQQKIWKKTLDLDGKRGRPFFRERMMHRMGKRMGRAMGESLPPDPDSHEVLISLNPDMDEEITAALEPLFDLELIDLPIPPEGPESFEMPEPNNLKR